MANYSAIKATVNAYIKANGKKEITGHILNSVLNATIDSLGRYFQFAGGALPTDDPGTPDQNVCYLAGEPGVYTNFGGITIENEEVALLFWDGEWTKQRILIGIQEVEASVDNQVGTPSVDVSYSNGQLVLTFHNLKGEQGAAAGFGTIAADINEGVGTPGVSVETSGDNTAKNLMFHFTNLKGDTGVTSVVATIDDTSGTPSCQVSLVNGVLTLAFSGLKGLKGDTGVSADYPIAIYNGLDSDATDQALAAAQGKVLDGKISQLRQEVDDIDSVLPKATEPESYTGRILEFDGLAEVPTISGSNDITIAGRNLFNVTSRVVGKIKNDSGVEVNDTVSNYFDTFIPAYGGVTLSTNENLQRVYYYTPDKQWIGRSESFGSIKTREIPATVDGQVVGWIQIQVQNVNSINLAEMMVNYGNSVLPFESYKSNSGDAVYSDYSLIYSNDMSEITVTITPGKYAEIQEKLVSGENIKTVNGQSLLGGGDIPITAEINGVNAEVQQTSRFFEIINNGDPTTIPSGVIIAGRNLFNVASRVVGKIKNDSGVEVNDAASNYFATFIPAYGGVKLSTNENLQRVYYYTPDKQWIGRSESFGSIKTREIPATVDGQVVGWIQIQVQNVNSINLAEMMVNYGDSVLPFEAYKSKTTTPLYDGYNILYKDDLSPFTVTIKTATKLQVPGISIPAIYEPETVDGGYSSPIGTSNTIRANWSAEDKYTYYEFLAAYYDKYLGGSFGDGYSVRKRSLGNDCSNLGYEMFEYDFCPANYTRVVMLSAGMNTNETSGIWGVATFMRCVMEDNETVFSFLRENVRFIVLPIICPSSFDQATLKYPNYNNVRVNKNFNFNNSWNEIHIIYPAEPVGSYPDSEAETQNLKKWINKYSGLADLYIDCHSDDNSTGDNYNTILTQVICSDSVTRSKLEQCFSALVSYYTDKGYIGEGVTAKTQSWVEGGRNYPKTLYAKQVCQIPAIMIEQYICSTMYGSDGQTNNDTYGIKNYVAMLRLYIMTILQENNKIVPIGDVPMNGYHLNYK